MVIGGDSLVGAALAASFRSAGAKMLATTRRQQAGGSGYIYFDLINTSPEQLPVIDGGLAYVCAGITNISACERNPTEARNVNVEATVALIKRLLERKLFVVFLSSNTVFDGNSPWPDEFADYSPTNEYGRQKVETEQHALQLGGADEFLAIVRLSKVVSRHSGIASAFYQQLATGNECRAFNDLRMSPVSLAYVVSGLKEVGLRKLPGRFHLSGANELSYADFAAHLATHAGFDQKLIKPTTFQEAGAEVLFHPLFPGLGMQLTSARLGIEPEPLEHVVKNICENND